MGVLVGYRPFSQPFFSLQEPVTMIMIIQGDKAQQYGGYSTHKLKAVFCVVTKQFCFAQDIEALATHRVIIVALGFFDVNRLCYV